MIDFKNMTSADWIELTEMATKCQAAYFDVLRNLCLARCWIHKTQFEENDFNKFEKDHLQKFHELYKKMGE